MLRPRIDWVGARICVGVYGARIYFGVSLTAVARRLSINGPPRQRNVDVLWLPRGTSKRFTKRGRHAMRVGYVTFTPSLFVGAVLYRITT